MARQGTFARAVAEFAKGAMQKEQAVFVSVAAQTKASVADGSALTGAPQMPVAPSKYPRAGSLGKSVTLTFPDVTTALVYTASPYAKDVEDNAKGHTFNEGGPHGWKLTRAAFDKIVETTVARQARAKS